MMGRSRMAKKIIIAVCAVAVVLAALLALIIPKLKHPQAEKRYSVLLITLDSVTARYLSCYGYERKTTPYLDRFAQEHVRFTQAFGQAFYTGPAHASLLSSLYPRTSGVFRNSVPIDEGTVMLAGSWRSTATQPPPWSIRISSARNSTTTRDSTSILVVEGHPERKEPGMGYDLLFGLAEKWIAENHGGEFFCWVHCNYPHSFYVPRKEFRNLWYSEENYRKMKIKHRYTHHDDMIEARKKGTLTEDEVAYAKSQYDGELVQTDEVLHKFLNRVLKLVPLDRLIVVIMGDHGEIFDFKNNRFGHGHYLYEDVIHVPLIMAVPLAEGKRFQKMVVNETVQGIDIAPTILDLLGMKIPAAFQGVSFADFFKEGPKPIHSELILGPGIADEPACIRKDNWKLIIYDDKTMELYNLAQDPHEDRNLISSEPEQTKKLLALYKQWTGFVPHYDMEKLKAKTGELSPHILEILKKSGYLKDEKGPGKK
jgi:arylsulfatase A-like enzyme